MDRTRRQLQVRRRWLSRWLQHLNPMVVRTSSGVTGAALYLLVLFFPVWHGFVFTVTIALFSVFGAWELYRGVERQGGDPSEVLGFVACIVFQFTAWTYGGARFAPYLPALLLLLVIAALITELFKGRARPIVNVSTTLLGAVYVGWLSSYLTLLHGMEAPVLTPPILGTTTGEWLAVLVPACTWLSDAGALFVGKALGRHKLAPSISPSKTWEGSLGGVLIAVLGAVLIGLWVHLPLRHAVGLGMLCAIAGQVGDLSESALKRDLGVKDFGSVIPGHGGILDRIDSLLFSTPLAYYYVLFFLVRH